MTIETTTSIGGLNPALPGGTDEIKEGDDHIRLLKSVLIGDAASLSKATPQTFAGPVNFAQNVTVTGDIAVTGNLVGNAKVTGVQTLENVAPELRFAETDQTDPNGRFRFLGNGNTFALQKALTANWASNEQIWAYAANALQISKDAIFAAGVRIENTTPDLRFADTSVTDPLGRYRINVLGDVIHLQRALTANWATSVDIWNYTHATAMLTVPGAATFAGATTFAGAATFTVVPRITGTSPTLQFLETDAVSPAGQFIFQGYGAGNFALNRHDGAGFTTPVNIWRYLGASATLSIDVPFANTIEIAGTGATIRFNENDQTDPAGRFALVSNLNSFSMYRYGAVNWGSATRLWNYTTSTNTFTFDTPVTFGASIYSSITIEGGSPSVRFLETDAVSPAGQYMFTGNGAGNFNFYRHNGANFTTAVRLSGYTASTDMFDFTAPVTITGADGAGSTSLRISTGYPTIHFHDTTPSGAPASPDLSMTAGSGWFRFGNADADGSVAAPAFTINPGANAVTSVIPFTTNDLTKLATNGSAVEIGGSVGGQITFKRPGINYLEVPNTWSLRVQNSSAVAWANISSASGWSAGSSDVRLKENVQPIHYGLDTVMALRPIQFDWIADKRHDIGFSAQDVEKIIPEIVEIWEADPDIEGQIDTYALRKDALTAVLIRAVQELTQRVVALEGTPA